MFFLNIVISIFKHVKKIPISHMYYYPYAKLLNLMKIGMSTLQLNIYIYYQLITYKLNVWFKNMIPTCFI